MPKTCPQCQGEAADDAAFCPKCGASLGAASPGATGAPPPENPAGPGGAGVPPTTGAPGRAPVPPYRFDAARWSLADQISGVATIVLFISLFLPWFSVRIGNPVVSFNISWSGLTTHGYLYIVMILTILIVAYLVLRAGWDELPVETKIPHVLAMMVLTLINVALVLIGFFSTPGSGWGWSFGSILALIAAVVAAAPYAIPQLRARTMH